MCRQRCVDHPWLVRTPTVHLLAGQMWQRWTWRGEFGCHKALSPSGDGCPSMAPTAITQRLPAIGAKIAKATWSGPLSKIVGLAVIHERGEGGREYY